MIKSYIFFCFLLFVLFLSFISNTDANDIYENKNYTEIFIPKGIPFGLPLGYKFFLMNVTGSAYFTQKTKYNCNSSHQYDWNKLTGVSFTPWLHNIDAMMVAWRYLIKTDTFEIGPYYNVNLANIMPQADETLIVKENEPFKFLIDYDGISIYYGGKSVYKPKPVSLKPDYYLSVRVDTWFGGSSLPPSDIYLYLCLV